MFTKDHTAKQYDQELDFIRSRVLLMGGLVENQLRSAIDAFVEGDIDKAARVDMEDHRVNALEVNIDLDCAQIIARRQPAAVDLRMLMGISKIVTDLERSGDEAAKIARMTRTIYGRDRCRVSCINDVRDMGNLAVAMLRAALDTFVRQDAAQAANIVREDLEIDGKFKALTRQLITFMMEDPRMISSALEIMFIAKAVERIGDHAKNLAEQVIYIVRGTDVRHVAIEHLEREARGIDCDE
ncbi:negative regulator of the pho regulon [Gammaproteobacteria bacterium]